MELTRLRSRELRRGTARLRSRELRRGTAPLRSSELRLGKPGCSLRVFVKDLADKPLIREAAQFAMMWLNFCK